MDNILYEKKLKEENMFNLFSMDLTPKEYQDPPLHWHSHIEILYLCAGDIILYYNTNRLHVKNDSLVLINSDVIHAVRRCNNQPLLYWVLHIDPRLLEQNHLRCDGIYFEPIISNESVIRLMREMLLEFEEKKSDYIQAIQCLILQLIIILKRNYCITEAESFNERHTFHIAKSVIEYIHSNYSDSFSLDVMCSQLSFSKYYVSRTFKEEVGVPIMDYVNEFRCHQAQYLLRTTNHTILTIAQMCGFRSASYFTRVYRKYLGNMPSDEVRHIDAAGD